MKPFLTYNPLQVFNKRKTPIALYVRQKWLQENTRRWNNDFKQTVDALYSEQSTNGSWKNALLTTVQRLFALHLTVRNKNEQIEKALEWLLSHEEFIEQEAHLHIQSEKVFARDLQNLPFSHGCYEHFAKCAILFLATIFGQEHDARVIRVYEMLRMKGEEKEGKWCTWSCSNNFLRAFVVHPKYRESKAVRFFLSRLEAVQREDGSWPIQIPFYQTVNALGHLNLEQSDKILKRALLKLRETQNSDGTWGKNTKSMEHISCRPCHQEEKLLTICEEI